MKKSQVVFISLLMILLCSDIIFSFYQHLQMPLDGDIAESVLPDDFVYKILNDPFGMCVLLHHEHYPNPNRFFAHGSAFLYLRKVPLMLQQFFSPVESVYIACAILKTALQVAFVFLLAMLSCGFNKQHSFKNYLVATVIITPLFQTAGYNRYMGVIDQSITYTFFYAWPFLLLILFLIPIYFYLREPEDYSVSPLWKSIMILLAVLLPFSSPLLPGVAIIISALFFIHSISFQNQFSIENRSAKTVLLSVQKIPTFILFILLFISALSLYSLYIGAFNSSNFLTTLSLGERYLKLPRGLFRVLTQKPGWLMLIGVVILNSLILLKMKSNPKSKSLLTTLKCILIFSLIYILVLPLGGFREYRSNIIRYDTFLPITICIIYYFGVSTLFILGLQNMKRKKVYIACIASILIAFTSADKIKGFGNACEKRALEQIAASQSEPVALKADCTILSWRVISDYRQSERNAALLQIWGVTNRPTRYYQIK